MNIEDYISSGLIEAYVLGVASPEEMHELELMASKHPEVATAISECREQLEQYATLYSQAPPDDMKEQIWSALQQEELPATISNQSKHKDAYLISDTNKPGRVASMYHLYRAVAVVLLIASMVFNLLLLMKDRASKQELAGLKAEQEKMNLLLSPAVKSIPLAGVGAHSANTVMLFWNTQNKEVYLSLKDLPAPPIGKQYQLWAIVDGKPINAGVYALNSNAFIQKMKVIDRAQMFAITLEKQGGSDQPTLTEMYVAGKV